MSLSCSVLGFNGVLHEVRLARQVLGNGYRVYCPALMRLHSPDRMSPFGKGGINPYVYCLDDPLNRMDPSGQWSLPTLASRLFGFKLRTPLMVPVAVASAGSLAAVGLAVASPNDTQRGLAIAGAVILTTGAVFAGRYAWLKRKPVAPALPAAGTPVTTPTSPVVTTPSTGSSRVSLGAATPSTPPMRPRHLALDGRQRRVPDRARLPRPPAPPVRRRGTEGDTGSAAKRIAAIRRGSA